MEAEVEGEGRREVWALGSGRVMGGAVGTGAVRADPGRNFATSKRNSRVFQ